MSAMEEPMSSVSSTLNDLAELTLIGSDASYFTSLPPIGTVLAPLVDNSYGQQAPNYDLSATSGFTVPEDPTKPGQPLASSDSTTGGKYVVYLNAATNQAIVAFGGTDGLNPKDWSQNTSLGWNQWEKMKQALFPTLSALVTNNPGLTINFTGQSLGGALAQYAAYDWVKENPTFNKSNV